MEKLDFYYNGSSDKKRKLITTIKNSKIKLSNKILILSLIDSGNLDNMINEIKEDNINIIKSPLVPKGYLTGYEQFISVLDKFISYILNLIDSPELIEAIIINCLKNNKILLSRKYVYDNENIDYYKTNYNHLIVNIFYNNLIKMKNDLSEELHRINFNIEKVDLSNNSSSEYLVRLISELVFLNKNDYKLLSLFTNISEKKYNIFLNWYKMLFYKYINNLDFISVYREYNKSNNNY